MKGECHSVAGILMFGDEPKVFIAKRNPVGQMGGRWEFPGGKVEGDEPFELTLQREYSEEFSAEIIVGNHICDGTFEHNGKINHLHAFEVSFADAELYKDLSSLVFTEHTEAKFVPLSSVGQLDFVDSDLSIYPEILKYEESRKSK
ncbi:MAG: NUDIX domain-containing protein [Treponemataceae bacterium]|nr:NUDIX domain-containing protein [Treponemataceae bacterium]